jgi:hypothetical protein
MHVMVRLQRLFWVVFVWVIAITASADSANEIARKLANPNSPLASLTFKYQYRTFDGDLPDAGDQTSSMVLFQPSFPFALDSGAVVFFRPAIPLVIDQPGFSNGSAALHGGTVPLGIDGSVFVNSTPGFVAESGIGDISFDLAYGKTTKTGFLWAVGMISSLPTATKDELGSDRFTLAPNC